MQISAPLFTLKRRARLAARDSGKPLHACLDEIARAEGFARWSQLAAKASRPRPSARLLAQLMPSDMMLLAARPGHGKTLLALELVAEAARHGQHGFIFTLDYTTADILARFADLGIDPVPLADRITLDLSDGICADHIIAQTSHAPADSMIIIDYLQLLDQKRDNPDLATQISALKRHAQASGQRIVLISQIDRHFDPTQSPLPGWQNVRLPNPVDVSLFTKGCFLHDGQISLAPPCAPVT